MGMLEDAIREYAKFEDRSTDPSTPSAGEGLIYFKDGKIHSIDDAGAVVEYGAGGGGGVFAGARLRKSTNTTLSTGTNFIEFNVEDIDTDDFHEGVTNPSRLTIPAGMGGIYHVGAAIQVSAGTERIISSIRPNDTGAEDIAAQEMTGSATGHTPRLSYDTIAELDAGDYLELTVFRTGGGTLEAVALRSPVLWAYKIG